MMRVKCSLCEKLETIDDDTLVAKRLRNRPIHTYMCDDCQEPVSYTHLTLPTIYSV